MNELRPQGLTPLHPHVVWVSFAPLEKNAGGMTSSFASVRYRLIVPSKALESQGWKSRVTHLSLQANRRTLLSRFEGVQVALIGKLIAASKDFARSAQLAKDVIEELRARKIKIIADFCDDNFSEPRVGQVYRMLSNAADAVVASTPQLAEVLSHETAAPVSVVTDPVEGERGEPRVPHYSGASSDAQPVQLLWYGHPVNLDTLRYGLPQIARFASGRLICLTIVSAGQDAEALVNEIDQVWRPMGSQCHFVPWSTESLFSELRACDAVVIPSNPHDPRRAIKSPNRFTEALWGGRFVLAHPLPAYEQLSEYGWVGEDLDEGLLWFVQNPAEARDRIQRGQAAVAERFSPQAVADCWKAVILKTLEQS